MLKFGKNEPDIGLCHDGRLDPFYFRDPGLSPNQPIASRITSGSSWRTVRRLRVREPYRPNLSDHSCKVATLPVKVPALKEVTAFLSAEDLGVSTPVPRGVPTSLAL